ncbi:MAG: septum formation initiator family protein [Anaerolineaceae bacterium]|nr:septum formation initiator family protein [Anaerolineaceae bacterium]
MVMKAVWDSRKRIIGLGAIALLVLFMMNINSRLSEYFHLSSERDKIDAQVNNLRATKVALDTLAAYATSDAAVVDWARDEAHMALPGDNVMIPVTPNSPVIKTEAQVTPVASTTENWQVWYILFFGKK